MQERVARACLTAVVEPGHPALADAVREFGAEEVWHGLLGSDGSGGLEQRARRVRPAELMARAAHDGQRFVMPGDDEWPTSLFDLRSVDQVRDLSGEPLGLWVSGDGRLAELVAGSVAIVGSRASTGYGDQVAADLAAELSEAGCAVVSGGAYGIDAAAHRGALAGRTPTVAVLAGGLDQPYPAGHARLFARIQERGVVVSELPSGEHPTRVRFLARNRLIAAITTGTVIVEAAMRSGARNTVTWATALSRLVMAVPGPVTSANSVTPHRLIREAEAVLVTSAADILELLGPLNARAATPTLQGPQRPTDLLSGDALRVYESVPGRGAICVGDLAIAAGVAIPACLAILSRLADEGLLSQNTDGEWRLAATGRR